MNQRHLEASQLISAVQVKAVIFPEKQNDRNPVVSWEIGVILYLGVGCIQRGCESGFEIFGSQRLAWMIRVDGVSGREFWGEHCVRQILEKRNERRAGRKGRKIGSHIVLV